MLLGLYPLLLGALYPLLPLEDFGDDNGSTATVGDWSGAWGMVCQSLESCTEFIDSKTRKGRKKKRDVIYIESSNVSDLQLCTTITDLVFFLFSKKKIVEGKRESDEKGWRKS